MMYNKQMAIVHLILLIISVGITFLLNSCNFSESANISDIDQKINDSVAYTINRNNKLKTIQVEDNKMIILEANDKVHIHTEKN